MFLNYAIKKGISFRNSILNKHKNQEEVFAEIKKNYISEEDIQELSKRSGDLLLTVGNALETMEAYNVLHKIWNITNISVGILFIILTALQLSINSSLWSILILLITISLAVVYFRKLLPAKRKDFDDFKKWIHI